MAQTKKEIINQLSQMGLSKGAAHQLYKIYGAQAATEIENNPYILVQLFDKTNWAELDKLANHLGFEESSSERLNGATLHALRASTQDGHVFLPRNELYQRINRLIRNDDINVLDSTISQLEEALEIVLHEDSVYLENMHTAETGIASKLKEIHDSVSRVALQTPDEDQLDQVQNELNISLAKAQREAVIASMQNKILIITGGPGTGKTTIVRGVLHLWEKQGVHIQLAAPTGRAARRLRDSTGRNKASTIHRLLEFNPDSGTFNRNARRKLKVDLLVIDEASMIDTELMASLLEALPLQTHIVLVGDVDQLPSVGPGFVLHDLISSECIKTIHLHEIFRQAEGSLISLNAQKINEGTMPDLDGDGLDHGQDFFFINKNDPRAVQDAIIEMVMNRIPSQFGLNPKEDIQVLSPMYKREAGVNNLNELLQQNLNPCDGKLKGPFYSFALGDKVMQIRNDYTKDVFNGDIGLISGVDRKKDQVMIVFDGVEKIYKWDELDNTSLAYAVTVHKSQGSEYPAVVMPLTTKHYPMLQRNLLYTGVSRGKQLVVLVGQRKALEMAIKNNKIRTRHTALQYWVKHYFEN